MDGKRVKKDIVIVGGGMIGHSLACALSYFQPQLQIAILEANAPSEPKDKRMLSLAHSSYCILSRLQLWKDIAPIATEMHEVHVSQKGRFGTTRFKAKEQGLSALGYAVPAAELVKQLWKKTAALQNVDVLAPALVKDFRYDGCSMLTVDVEGKLHQYDSELVIAADGSYSTLRNLQNIETVEHDYQEDAIIATVSLARPHNHIAYERFTSLGPLAMLPSGDNTCTMIWSCPTVKSKQLLALDDAAFLDTLKEYFGYRLGALQAVSPRVTFPLKRIEAKQQVTTGLVLLGNAAHTMHPIAAQGFNLGLRDAVVIAELLAKPGNDLATKLQEYTQWREKDQKRITVLTHQLSTLFNSRLFPVVKGRSFAMMCLDLLPPLNRLFAKNTSGLLGKRPILACELE